MKVLPKRKQDKTKARREGGKQGVTVLPRDREINAGAATEPHHRKEEAITTPCKAKHGNKNVMKTCPEIKPCSQSTFPFKLKNG